MVEPRNYQIIKLQPEQFQEAVITVNAAPFAYGFYEKLGFVATGAAEETHGIISKPMVYHNLVN